MIISVLNTKGGVGKSTISLNLAIMRATSGKEVLLVDGDRQATIMQAIAQRASLGASAAASVAVAHLTEGPLLRAQVLQARTKYDDIVIDAGGRDSTALRAALMVSDIVLMPFQPRSFDVWGIGDMAELIKEACCLRQNLNVFAVLNGADSRGHDNAAAADAVSEMEHIQYLNTPIGRRKSLADSAGSGLSIIEWKPKDTKATTELTSLYNSIYQSS
jgi:chromosome partitioning protein